MRTILTDNELGHADTRPTYHGYELKGQDEPWNEFVREGNKTGEATDREDGEEDGAEPRRPSHEDGSYEAVRCCKIQLSMLVITI